MASRSRPFSFTRRSTSKSQKSSPVSIKFFSKNDDDIQTIESFELKLNVTDPKPVWKPYWTIPKQLYFEVKQCLEILIKNWIKNS